ncbi:pyruvate dehydrogenase (acetyl-transferring), homodimeric type [Halarcobacter anaerophilus]|jgi:pyruvate dehydrogenase E1 component|uniref:Pyruvate dehydrogenase E1 component n=1 Tax=Halarcobacter anaerophilus TaxID=877500 RepID=A0A4Q0Y0M2_9BACT|nr:pyruvate dehydrogenase (acetyl-transferring), homodimeric type [Halarcobacter anaerophilus]QDF28862.1 pyruvate dehydrogenase multienzyme complex, E1 component pyruvate dehydrogenase [Halarcobacter anaerophilus]RXJ63502.1 pyruvate dehydrogenase (acetyl-transferring), homodimeric type [Halarcobacter anaerophilus]
MSEINLNDIDPQETQEWLDALEVVIQEEGSQRAHYILEKLIDKARRNGTYLPFSATTAYVNTIPVEQEPKMPGNLSLERKIRSIVRWNAQIMVQRASQKKLELGGHISSFQSSATLYDVAFNHFFKAPNEINGGDLIFFQGHIAPGIYARSFVEGRISQEQMDNFRQEAFANGLSSYPHPRLMPDYWQFPTVSMGLGPIQAIYQARFLKYLTDRGIKDCSDQKVYCYMGDGECDEPESLGAIGLAGREGLDNLIFVINCNLQRLDGPVRGNGKIIQELEGEFRGAGWEVIKVIWGRHWDALLEKDKSGKLLQLMEETVDGEYQNFKQKGGAYTREHFFNKHPETAKLVENMSDDDIWRLNRGGHDPIKVYAAYKKANETKGRPSVILAKTVKGYGMGAAAEGKNIAHQVKKVDIASLRQFRDRFDIPISDEDLEKFPYYKPAEDSEEMKYLKQKRAELGGFVPQRRTKFSDKLEIPALSAFDAVLKGSQDREISTTMAFVRVLNVLVKDKSIGKKIVPIVPDEARTFGMEGMFRQIGIYSHEGQKYIPQDRDQVAYYKEDKKGQVLQEGINELGAMGSWVAAATSYSVNNCPMIPFYVFYSMFGFQRTGDMCWAAGDQKARGFLVGGTSGRTTLNGEGLQHEDGHSHILSNTIPNCVSYDPTYGYEVAVIVQNGIERMYGENQEDVFFYITTLNENYQQPAMPEGIEEGILKGIYKVETKEAKNDYKVKLLGSGSIFQQVIKAAEILADEYEIKSDIYSVTSYNELTREAQDAERYNLLHIEEEEKVPYVQEVLNSDEDTVIVSATDYIKSYSEQIAPYLKGSFKSLGTDGFGRSDSRSNLRSFFEVDTDFIVFTTLAQLYKKGKVKKELVNEAMKKYNIDPEKINPLKA